MWLKVNKNYAGSQGFFYAGEKREMDEKEFKAV